MKKIAIFCFALLVVGVFYVSPAKDDRLFTEDMFKQADSSSIFIDTYVNNDKPAAISSNGDASMVNAQAAPEKEDYSSVRLFTEDMFKQADSSSIYIDSYVNNDSMTKTSSDKGLGEAKAAPEKEDISNVRLFNENIFHLNDE